MLEFPTIPLADDTVLASQKPPPSSAPDTEDETTAKASLLSPNTFVAVPPSRTTTATPATSGPLEGGTPLNGSDDAAKARSVGMGEGGAEGGDGASSPNHQAMMRENTAGSSLGGGLGSSPLPTYQNSLVSSPVKKKPFHSASSPSSSTASRPSGIGGSGVGATTRGTTATNPSSSSPSRRSFQEVLHRHQSHQSPLDPIAEKWMTTLGTSSIIRSTLGEASMSMIPMLGSHDSATYGIHESSDFAADAPKIIEQVPRYLTGFTKKLVSHWARCQSVSVIEQLYRGVRYFDIRLSPRKKDAVPTPIHPKDPCHSRIHPPEEMRQYVAPGLNELYLLPNTPFKRPTPTTSNTNGDAGAVGSSFPSFGSPSSTAVNSPNGKHPAPPPRHASAIVGGSSLNSDLNSTLYLADEMREVIESGQAPGFVKNANQPLFGREDTDGETVMVGDASMNTDGGGGNTLSTQAPSSSPEFLGLAGATRINKNSANSKRAAATTTAAGASLGSSPTPNTANCSTAASSLLSSPHMQTAPPLPANPYEDELWVSHSSISVPLHVVVQELCIFYSSILVPLKEAKGRHCGGGGSRCESPYASLSEDAADARYPYRNRSSGQRQDGDDDDEDDDEECSDCDSSSSSFFGSSSSSSSTDSTSPSSCTNSATTSECDDNEEEEGSGEFGSRKTTRHKIEEDREENGILSRRRHSVDHHHDGDPRDEDESNVSTSTGGGNYATTQQGKKKRRLRHPNLPTMPSSPQRSLCVLPEEAVRATPHKHTHTEGATATNGSGEGTQPHDDATPPTDAARRLAMAQHHESTLPPCGVVAAAGGRGGGGATSAEDGEDEDEGRFASLESGVSDAAASPSPCRTLYPNESQRKQQRVNRRKSREGTAKRRATARRNEKNNATNNGVDSRNNKDNNDNSRGPRENDFLSTNLEVIVLDFQRCTNFTARHVKSFLDIVSPLMPLFVRKPLNMSTPLKDLWGTPQRIFVLFPANTMQIGAQILSIPYGAPDDEDEDAVGEVIDTTEDGGRGGDEGSRRINIATNVGDPLHAAGSAFPAVPSTVEIHQQQEGEPEPVSNAINSFVENTTTSSSCDVGNISREGSHGFPAGSFGSSSVALSRASSVPSHLRTTREGAPINFLYRRDDTVIVSKWFNRRVDLQLFRDAQEELYERSLVPIHNRTQLHILQGVLTPHTQDLVQTIVQRNPRSKSILEFACDVNSTLLSIWEAHGEMHRHITFPLDAADDGKGKGRSKQAKLLMRQMKREEARRNGGGVHDGGAARSRPHSRRSSMAPVVDPLYPGSSVAVDGRNVLMLDFFQVGRSPLGFDAFTVACWRPCLDRFTNLSAVAPLPPLQLPHSLDDAASAAVAVAQKVADALSQPAEYVRVQLDNLLEGKALCFDPIGGRAGEYSPQYELGEGGPSYVGASGDGVSEYAESDTDPAEEGGGDGDGAGAEAEHSAARQRRRLAEATGGAPFPSSYIANANYGGGEIDEHDEEGGSRRVLFGVGGGGDYSGLGPDSGTVSAGPAASQHRHRLAHSTTSTSSSGGGIGIVRAASGYVGGAVVKSSAYLWSWVVWPAQMVTAGPSDAGSGRTTNVVVAGSPSSDEPLEGGEE